MTEAYAYDNPAFFTALFRSVLLASHFIRALCDPPQQFSGTARAETWLVTFVTEVSLRLAAPRTGGALYRRYLASRLALSSPDLFSSAPTTDQGESSPRLCSYHARPPSQWSAASRHVSFSFPRHFSPLPRERLVVRDKDASRIRHKTWQLWLAIRIFALVTNKSLLTALREPRHFVSSRLSVRIEFPHLFIERFAAFFWCFFSPLCTRSPVINVSRPTQ